jgi:hypothetical protein
MYVIDFEDIKQWPHCQRDDYEHWSPPTPELCLLGHNFTYERRKRDSECFNPKQYDRPISSSICECGNEDLECEYGYFRSNYLEPCEKIGQIAEERVCPALDEGYHISSTHARFVHGDNCSHPHDVIPDYDDVKGNHHRHRGGSHFFGGLFITMVVVAALACVFFVWVRMFASEDVRDNVEDYCRNALLCCGSGCSLVGDCLGGLVSKLTGGRSSGSPADHFFRPLADNDMSSGDCNTSPLVLPGQNA